MGSGAVQFPEIRGEPAGDMNLMSDKAAKHDVTNRSHSPKGTPSAATPAMPATSATIAGTPGVATTFKGLNHRDQRTANTGYPSRVSLSFHGPRTAAAPHGSLLP